VAADRRWIHDHITREVRPDDAEAFALLTEGGTYRDVPAHLRRYRSDIFTDKYKRLSRDELSRTITAHLARDGYWYIHPDQDRTLSVREAARVQAFPDWFRFAGEPSLRYRQIGNAVPPLLAEAVGQSLLAALDRRVRRTHVHAQSFRTDLLAWHASNSRQYPWRSGGNPWTVLLAEMCLRRTRADQVAPIYERLIAMAPNPISMQQKADKVRELLTPLGLRWRVDNILDVANVILERHGGEVPDSREQLTSLPGVGDYVANAVLCFGYGRAAILMDTNTQRIASRVMGRDPLRRVWQTRLDLYRLAGSDGAGPDMNYALLDLGALVCRASTPRCSVCPVAAHCLTFSADN
jgi:DNA (cytosine-5)-methyltransferase 1